jgi:hypothetical protein
VIGRYAQPYPEVYQARPYSRRYVLHLDLWYAQSHPAEDFAETFAVWLRPRSDWRREYVGWPALRKLEYVDGLMAEIGDGKPRVRTRRRSNPLARIRKTLREHYRERRARYGFDDPTFYDRELGRLFSEVPDGQEGETAAEFLRRLRPEYRARIARWTGQYRYVVDEVLDEVIERCDALGLWRRRSEREARTDTLIVLTAITMNHVHAGHHRMIL